MWCTDKGTSIRSAKHAEQPERALSSLRVTLGQRVRGRVAVCWLFGPSLEPKAEESL